MFTGIIEHIGKIKAISEEGSNRHFSIQSPITHELYIDQSVAHNGVCLTVVRITGDAYTVTAVEETLNRTHFRHLKAGDLVNLERSMPANGRFDGHVVQGHVDDTAKCISIEDRDGSHVFTFQISSAAGQALMVEKGSICVNGISLTIAEVTKDNFSVAIIPYTYMHTNLQSLVVGDLVNIEFDIIGKYVAAMLRQRGA